MVKSIKFNIMVDNKPLRDIEDLNENFNLDDMLVHQQSGLLQRWLVVRGLTDVADRVAALSSMAPLEAAQKLCQIFHSEISEEQIAAAVYPLEYAAQHAARLDELKKCDFARQQVLDDYHEGYARVLQSMLEHPTDYALIKSAMNEIWKMYRNLFFIDFNRFYTQYIQECPLALFAMTANEYYREDDFFSQCDLKSLFSVVSSFQVQDINPIKLVKDTNRTWVHITDKYIVVDAINNLSGMVCVKDFDDKEYSGKESVGKKMRGLIYYSNSPKDYIKYTPASDDSKMIRPPFYSYAGETENYWKDIEPKGKLFMILKIEPGNFVRNCGRSGEEFNAEQVNGLFPILDGIDYKSNNAAHHLLYMEV